MALEELRQGEGAEATGQTGMQQRAPTRISAPTPPAPRSPLEAEVHHLLSPLPPHISLFFLYHFFRSFFGLQVK